LTTLLVVISTFALAGAALLHGVRLAALSESHQQALILGRTLAGSFAVPMSLGQHEVIQRQIDQIAELPDRFPDVLGVAVVDSTGHVIAASDPSRFGDIWTEPVPMTENITEDFSAGMPRITLRMPVETAVWFGSLELVLSVHEPWKAAAEASRGILISLIFAMFALVTTLSLLLNQLVVRPVTELATAVTQFTFGRSSLGVKAEGADEMRMLVGAFDQMASRLHEYTGGLEHKVEERTRELRNALDALQKANWQLQQLAVTDALTGVANRRAFTDRLALEVDRARRGGQPLSLILFDLDNFKRLNDTRGHLEGDVALVQLATLLSADRRGPDLVARYGGEEFILLLPDTRHDDAILVAERLRQAVQDAGPSGLTVSAGVATLPDHAEDGRSLIAAADHAMYAAKAAGRNRVRSAGESPVTETAVS
jgi:diguanylate cyclase (GGDEF)-like protein